MAIRGFKINPTTGDIDLFNTVSGAEATAQEISTRLKFFKGESFTDLREGTPWFQEILVKGGDPARVRAIIRQVIQSVPAVLDVPVCDFVLDRSTRSMRVVFEVRDRTGATIRSEDFPPLVIGAQSGRP